MNNLEMSTRRSKMAANNSALLQAKTAQWSTAKINLNIFSLKDAFVTDEDNGVTEVTLFAKNHWFLRVQGDGNVSGTRNQASNEGILKSLNCRRLLTENKLASTTTEVLL